MEKPFPAYQGDDPHVFVCYAHADADLVYREIVWLRDQGFHIWYDEGISPGTTWRNELADSISNAKLFLFFVTPQSVDSINCQREVNFAVDHNIPVIAVHLEETDLASGMDLTRIRHRYASWSRNEPDLVKSSALMIISSCRHGLRAPIAA